MNVWKIGNLIFIIDKRFDGGKHSIYRYAPYVQYINVKHEISSNANVSFVSITALAEQESSGSVSINWHPWRDFRCVQFRLLHSTTDDTRLQFFLVLIHTIHTYIYMSTKGVNRTWYQKYSSLGTTPVRKFKR